MKRLDLMLFVVITEVSSIFCSISYHQSEFDVLFNQLSPKWVRFFVQSAVTEVSSILISCHRSEFDFSFNQLSPKGVSSIFCSISCHQRAWVRFFVSSAVTEGVSSILISCHQRREFDFFVQSAVTGGVSSIFCSSGYDLLTLPVWYGFAVTNSQFWGGFDCWSSGYDLLTLPVWKLVLQ